MSEQTVEERAAEMGWAPKDKWRGPEEAWVDAEAFVKRGEEVLPILRHNNQRLLGEVASVKQQLAAEKAAREATEAQLKDFAAFQAEEVARQVKEKEKDLRKQIRAAREAGNEVLEDSLSEELDDLKTKPPVKKVDAPAPPAPPSPDPAYLAWAQANADWFGDSGDVERTSLALGVAAKIRKTHPLLTGAAFFVEVDKRMAKFLQPPPVPSKVEGGDGAPGGGGGGNGTSFTDLPADAKAQCASDAKRFVGDKKLFKTEKEWQTHYANVYFQAQGRQA